MANYSRPTGHGPASRPISVPDLAKEAEAFVFNAAVPLRQWVGAADTLYREGSIYKREGNYPKAYLLLLRFSFLVVQHLSRHPLAKTLEGKKMLKPLKDRLPNVLNQLEAMKPHIDEAFQEWQRMSEAEQAQLQDFSSEVSSEYAAHAAKDPALSWSNTSRAQVLDAGENQEFAVDLATKEFKRRRAERRPGTWDGDDERRSGGVWEGWDQAPAQHGTPPEDDLRAQMELARQRLDRPGDFDRPNLKHASHSTSYNYPTISKSKRLEYEPSRNEINEIYAREREPQPPRPPKQSLQAYAPLPPRKETFSTSMPPHSRHELDSASGPPTLPPKPEAQKKERYTFKAADYLENGEPLRPVFLPYGLRKEFVRLAAEKTRKGIEMCGLLCGTIVNNALFVTCLLIPEQNGTPDTCETVNESTYFDYMDKEDLVQLGWIHTHPTQTCFMSSRDLHTHAGYQIMIPESIAIVCAPQFEPSWGVFRLTHPPGLNHLLQCTKTDTFHQHDIDSDRLYREASRPSGHVYVSSKLDYFVHDLRPKD